METSVGLGFVTSVRQELLFYSYQINITSQRISGVYQAYVILKCNRDQRTSFAKSEEPASVRYRRYPVTPVTITPAASTLPLSSS
jgi:hypothetical protein